MISWPNPRPAVIAAGVNPARAIADHIYDNWVYAHHHEWGINNDPVPEAPSPDTIAALARCFIHSRKAQMLAKPRILKGDVDVVVGYILGDGADLGQAQYWALRALTLRMSWHGGYGYSSASSGSLWPMMDEAFLPKDAVPKASTFAVLWCLAVGRNTSYNAPTRWHFAIHGE